MKDSFISLSHLSLRVKLVLSYLAVTLGAILVLAFAVSLAVQSYFTNTQLDLLRLRAQYQAQRIVYRLNSGDSLGIGSDKKLIPTLSNDPVLIAIADVNGNQVLCSQPVFLTRANCDDPTLKRALQKTINGEEVNGDLQVSTDTATVSSLYVSIPLQGEGGKILGAMFMSAPEQSPNHFLSQVNKAIFIAGLIVSLVVALFSFLLVRRLTRPLELLTATAEQMKQGQYAQRVAQPKTEDELGRLASTFNAMADTIEGDMNELRGQEQKRRDLIANIAHDLATPLTAIQGFSEALADGVVSDEAERHETAQRIAREVQRLRRLVADMQQMSSFESGRARLDLATLDLHALVDETLAVIEPECAETGITVHNEIPVSLPPALADSDRITQVLLNLLDNARRHTPPGGKISVGAVATKKDLSVWVRDTGAGIDSSDLPYIFERFYRADRSRTTSTGGSGLGLSIVKAIIQQHNGTIAAESIPGQGTCITFTLPRA